MQLGVPLGELPVNLAVNRVRIVEIVFRAGIKRGHLQGGMCFIKRKPTT